MKLSRQTLSDNMIIARLSSLSGWSYKDHALERGLEFTGFTEAIKFICDIAPHAEELDHHPELFNVYNRLTIRLNTHDAKGVTDYDFALAERIDSEIGKSASNIK